MAAKSIDKRSVETARTGRSIPADARRFYEEALDDAERASMRAALEEHGDEEDVALLRVLLRRVLKERPDDLRLMFSGADHLSKALARRFRLNKTDREALRDSYLTVLAEFPERRTPQEAGDE